MPKKTRKPARNTRTKSRPAARKSKRGGKQTFWNYIWFGGAALLIIGLGYWSVNRSGNRSTASKSFRGMSTLKEAFVPSKGLSGYFQKSHSLDLGERVTFWSEQILSGRVNPETLRMVASKKIEDSAPLVPNAFNCTTYVETVAALTQSKSEKDFMDQLMAIRYKNANPTYANRNHFPEADWIPNNEKSGILKDITADVADQGGAKVDYAKKNIDRGTWLKKNIQSGAADRKLASLATTEWGKPVEVKLAYITVEEATKLADKIPSGTIVNVVREDVKTNPVLINHQGLAIRIKGKLMLRHASVDGHIRTVSFEDYLTKRSRGPASLGKVIGVNLNQVVESKSFAKR